MRYKIIKSVNPRYDGLDEIEIDFTGKKSADRVNLFGEELTITQLGDIVTLVGYREDIQVLYVLQRIYEEKPYITNYMDIREPEHLIVNENEKIFVVKHPMSLEALYKYIRSHPTPEPSIKQIGDNRYEFINGWRLYGSESHQNIKEGNYSYESKVMEIS